MNKLKTIFVVLVSAVVGLYGLFLLSPLIITPIVNAQKDNINKFVKESTGFGTDISGISFITAWNFSAGIKIKEIKLALPDSNKSFFYAQNTGVKLSLIPILSGKLQLDSMFSDAVYADIVVKPDGTLELLDYLPKTKEASPKSFDLPFGLKLSNHLPNLFVKEYKIAVIDKKTSRAYSMEGEDFKITNFVLDKSVKISSKGKLIFNDSVISNYDIKADNRIMPNIQLQDLIFPQEAILDETEAKNDNKADLKISLSPVLDVFDAIYKNKLRADINTDVKISGEYKRPHIDGHLKVSNLSIASGGKNLPSSYLDLLFKGYKTKVDSIFYTSFDKNEMTQLAGEVASGKKSHVDLSFRSNAKFQNVINLVNSVAKAFNINDFETLSATGGLDANLKIKSDFKKVVSNGYLKVEPSSLNYGLYNVKIDNITADINLENNDIKIKNAGFSILGQPMKLSGSILSDTTTDLKLWADKLSLKGLLLAFGQTAILKENSVSSGVVSINSTIKGKLKEIKPEIYSTIENVDVYNKSAQTRINLSKALLKILYDGKTASGNVDVNSLGVNISGSKVSVPKMFIDITPENINIKNSYLVINNSRVEVIGSIKDYLNDKMAIDFKANGNLQSSDIALFLPIDFRKLISYRGKLPLSIVVTGNSKVQNIVADLSADPSNYISLIDIGALKGQKTKIHTAIEIIGDSLSLSNTTISNEKTSIAKVSGGITRLYSNPQMNVNITVPNIISFPIWGVPSSNISANGTVTVTGSVMKPNMRGTVNITDISIKNMDLAISDIVADLSGEILNGSATAKQFKYGGIVATDLVGKISLKNYEKFYLTEACAKSFEGNVSGKIVYDIPQFKTGVEFVGTGLNSTKAIEGAVGIKKAITGTMGFDGKLTMRGVTDKEIINSMKGDLNFNVNEGRFVSIGKIENLVAAQNVNSNSILKAAIAALSTAAAVQEADRFKSITGVISFSNGAANLTKVLVAGPLMSYYVKGSYYIIPNSATLTILGRLESKVVSLLGPLGQLSADKLLSYIPKFGSATASILNQLTSDPANENTSLIPALSGGSTSYKDFKVIFNGPVESSSSVRTFKWLSTCDVSKMDVKQDLQNAVDAAKQNVNTTINDTKTRIENVQKNVTTVVDNQKKQIEQARKDIAQTKTDIQNAKQNAVQSAENLKNLFQNALKNSQTKMPSSSSETAAPTGGTAAE